MKVAIAERDIVIFSKNWPKGTIFTKHETESFVIATYINKKDGSQQNLSLNIHDAGLTEKEFFNLVHQLNQYPIL